MTSPFSDELISAYLDGELTAEEQARVEKQLREDAELRRMCDELRVLRATLQSMPVSEPAHDLADRVLRQAERRMLTGDEGAAPTTSPRTTGRSRGLAGSPLLRDWRVAASAVASLAALLLLVLWLPSQLHWGRTVATSQQVPTDAPAQTTETNQRLTDQREEMLAEGVDKRLRDLPTISDGAAVPAGNATTRPQAANDKDDWYSDDTAHEGQVKLKSDRGEAAGAMTNMYGSAARSVSVPEQETAPPSRGSSFSMSRSRPEPPANSPSAARPDAMRLESTVQEPDAAVPMTAGTAGSPAAPAGSRLPSATPETPLPADDNQSGDVAQSQPYMKENVRGLIDSGDTASLWQESRQAVAQQLISEFDKSHVLLVQVSLPARAQEDPSVSLGESALGATRLDEKTVPGLAPQLPRLNFYAIRQESPETSGKQLTDPAQEVILVEGSPDQIHTSLTNLVAQPEVQVVATNASQEQLRSLHVTMDDLARYRGFFPGSGGPTGGLGAAMGSGGMGPGGMGMGPGMGMGGGMGGYGGAAPSGMMPGAGFAGGGSGNPAEQGGYPGMGAGGSSAMPGQAPQKAPRSGGAKPGLDADSATDGVANDSEAAGQSQENSQSHEKKQPKTGGLGKPALPGGIKAERALGDALQQQEPVESKMDRPSSPTAGESSAAAKSARPTREALGRRSKAVLDSAEPEAAASTDQQPTVRTVVTYLFRLKPDAAPPMPAEQE